MKQRSKGIYKPGFVKIGSLVVLFMCLFPALYSAPTWYVDARCFNDGPSGAFDDIAVKDPTIVYSGGRYHMFYTGRDNGNWRTGYASATSIPGLNSATHYYMNSISESYFCAPQVFYFEPHNLWYLVYQDGTHGAAYATTTNISDPNSWSGPHSLEVPSGKGLDYWVICDDNRAYLYNTPDGQDIQVVRSTSLSNFPTGWGSHSTAISDTFEAVAVYKSLADGKYYLISEDLKDNRYYELWTSNSAGGPWSKIEEQWASRHNLVYNADHWTDNVSHGEIIRAGSNQKMEINDINRCDFLIQGVPDGNYGEYWQIPWDLGVIHNYSGQVTTPAPTPVPTNPPGSGGNITVRARGETGNETIEITAGGTTAGTFTVSASYQDYNVNGSGTVRVYFINDDGEDYDVQVDYARIDGITYQAEDQATNTGVYQDGSCGGSYSEWLHCDGYIEFGPSGSSTTTSAGGTTTTSTSGGGDISVRARGETGNETIEITAGGAVAGTFTVSTSYQTFSVNGSGTVRVYFTNDDGEDYDVQVDYARINGITYQAEDQATNTGVYQDESCGGSYSEWLHCDGYIEFDSTSGTTTSSSSTTTSSGGWWWW